MSSSIDSYDNSLDDCLHCLVVLFISMVVPILKDLNRIAWSCGGYSVNLKGMCSVDIAGPAWACISFLQKPLMLIKAAFIWSKYRRKTF